MADSPSTQTFPTDDSLCEQCGYPLKGLSIDVDCPECGEAVAESSPVKRMLLFDGPWLSLGVYWQMMRLFLIRPKQSFRALSIETDGLISEQFLFQNSFFGGLLFSVTVLLGDAFTIPLLSAMWFFVLATIGIALLTFIEMLGVTAFSKRRGWRVPFSLALRVCCFASVGWLPGAIVAGLGILLLEKVAAGQLWFEQLLGLVRVRWLFYAALFILSFLWFETLVWVGVRQVRYANARPDATARRAGDAPDL